MVGWLFALLSYHSWVLFSSLTVTYVLYLNTIQGILRKTTLTALETHSMMERITKGEIHPPWGGSMGAGAPKEDEKR